MSPLRSRPLIPRSHPVFRRPRCDGRLLIDSDYQKQREREIRNRKRLQWLAVIVACLLVFGLAFTLGGGWG